MELKLTWQKKLIFLAGESLNMFQSDMMIFSDQKTIFDQEYGADRNGLLTLSTSTSICNQQSMVLINILINK